MRLLRWMGALAVATLGAARALGAPVEGAGLEQTVTETIALSGSVAFVTAVSILGSGYAVGKIGAAAIGAAAEKPELLTRSLLFVALAEGLAILGFVVAMMLLAKIT